MARQDTLEYYDACFQNITLLPDWFDRIEQATNLIIEGKPRYVAVERALHNRVPWVFMALLHYREASCRFSRQILNGQRWDRKTTIQPKNYGPWVSWEKASEFGMVYWKMDLVRPWTIARILMECEDWNGEGYERRGKDSPYLWSGTIRGVGLGKFVSDGSYDATFVDKQVGCAPILYRLIVRNEYQGAAG